MRAASIPAKICRPRLFDVAPRERLFALLDANRERPLIWIAAPPGAGKTALVASWLESRGRPCLWFQADPGDTDPAVIYAHLAQAADAIGRGTARALPAFSPEHLVDGPGFAKLFFGSLWGRVPAGTLLVIDNYQDAPADSPLHLLLQVCVQHLPTGHSVLVISREESPPPFVTFAARGAMITLGWDRLQVTHDEAVAICAKRAVTESWLVQALHRQSQGWVAGITLMLERIAHANGSTRELPSDTRESVFHYFASLIFNDASAAERHVLLSVAYLPQVAASAAVSLSSDPQAPAYLEALHRRRLFTDRRPGEEPVYQFHALFLDFLRKRARDTLTADAFRELVERSASAMERLGDADGAMALWLEHDRFDEASRLLLAEAAGLLRAGRRQTLLHWIHAVSAPARDASHWIGYWRGRALLQTDPEAGSRVLEAALLGFRACGDHAGALDCLVSLVCVSHVGFHAIEAMDRWVDALVDETRRALGSLTPEAELRAQAALCVALFHTRPEHVLTKPARDRAEALLADCDDPDSALGAALGVVMVSGVDGDLAQGDRVVGIARALVARAEASPSESAWCLAHLGYLRYMEARYEEALDAFAESADIARANGLRGVLRTVLLWRHLVVWRLGQVAAAESCVAEVEAMTSPAASMNDALLLLAKARHAGHRGHAAESARLAALAWDCAGRTRSRVQLVMFGLACADAQLAAGRMDTASTLLDQVQAVVSTVTPFAHFGPATTLLEAWRDLLVGHHDRVRERLRAALTGCRDGSARHYLRLADRAMPPLFRIALDEGIEPELVRGIIRLLRLRPPPDAPDSWPWPVRVRTLGRFEVQVNGTLLEFPRKLPRKTLMLLKAIVAHGGRDVPEQWLCDMLWGDEDGDAASNALGITVVRLRKLLGGSEVILQQGGRISLNPELAWVDAFAFERHAAAPVDAAQTLSAYGGVFLPEDQGEPWSVAMRERLRGRFIDLLSRSGAGLEAAGDTSAAIGHYLRGIDADPVVEVFHQGLMRCYTQLGRETEAVSAYRRLRQTLSVTLGVPPSEASQAMHRRLLEQLASAPSAVLDDEARSTLPSRVPRRRPGR